MKEIITKWNNGYFGGQLSQAVLKEFDQIDADDRELLGFVDTWLYYFHMAGGNARNFSPLAARFFAKVTRSYMPSLWAKIPPITRGGRLRVIDRLVQEILHLVPDRAIRFLDVGCGYPPLPTIETAESCPAWTCVGVDPNFPQWILHDNDGTGACFDQSGTLVYIQYLEGGLQPEPERVEKDRHSFTQHWATLQNDSQLRAQLMRNEQLIVDPVNHYERHNLTFQAGTMTELNGNQKYDLIRCMNVFMYFTGETILKNIRHAKLLLVDAGVFVCGSIPESGSTAARYLVYQKRDSALVPWLFGMDLGKFSQRDGNGWWAFHRDQPDALFLAKVVRTLADDPALSGRVHNLIDRVEHELGYSHRDRDGYLHQTGFIYNTADNERLNMAIASEFGDEITAFLTAVGICSRITPFGHLVIDLPRSSPEHYQRYFQVL